MKHPVQFNFVIDLLKDKQKNIVEALRHSNGDVAWLENKRQIDCAIECLALCETYQIHPDSTVLTLPWPQDRFGEFQLIEIDESGHPLLEQQAILNEVPLTLGPGDLVIRVGHSFNLRFNPSNTASNSEPTSMS
jgi:hypothetical protein